MKVAVCGLAQSSRHLIPWRDETWEKWVLAWDPDRFQAQRAFEMHDWPLLVEYQTPKYIERLSELDRVVMYEAYPQVRNAEAYPFDAVIETIQADYFNSSIGLMVALAIHEGAEEIALYGVDMKSDSEYFYERPNVEYLVGLARGKGIKVTLPETSPVCKFVNCPTFEYGGRYGKSK